MLTPAAFFGHVRNKTDDALKLIAEKGGVIGANAFPPFMPKGFQSTLDDYIDAIDDLVERVGIDHVGIGTDFTQDQPKAFFDWLFSQQGTKQQERPVRYPDPMIHPEGMETPDKFSNIAVRLAQRGYSHDDVAKVLGGNWMRLFSQVWGGLDSGTTLNGPISGLALNSTTTFRGRPPASTSNVTSSPGLVRSTMWEMRSSMPRTGTSVDGCDDVAVHWISHAIHVARILGLHEASLVGRAIGDYADQQYPSGLRWQAIDFG